MRWIDLDWLQEDEEEEIETDKESLSYENRQREWTGFEGELWVNQWYRNQRRPIHKHYAQENRMDFTTFKGKLYKAIRREELEKYEQLTEEQLTELPEEDFYDLTDAVLSDLVRMENAVKQRKAMLDRIKKTRLANEFENRKGKVVELTDVVMMLTEQAGRTSWAKLIAELKQMHPDMADLIDELKERFTGSPVPMLKKYPKKKEPKKWKGLEHVPLRGAANIRRVAQQVDELAEKRLLKELDTFLDKWIQRLSSYLEMPVRSVACTNKTAVGSDSDEDMIEFLRDEISRLETELYELYDLLPRSIDPDDKLWVEKEIEEINNELFERKKGIRELQRKNRSARLFKRRKLENRKPEDKALKEIERIETDIYDLYDRRNRATDEERFHFEKDLDKLQSQLSERKKSFQQTRSPRASTASYYAEDEIMNAIEDLEYELNRLDRKMEEGYDTEDDFILRNEYQDELDDLQSQLRQTQRRWRKY